LRIINLIYKGKPYIIDEQPEIEKFLNEEVAYASDDDGAEVCVRSWYCDHWEVSSI
jgi:hypothetical protein